jgi:hypothetical protein
MNRLMIGSLGAGVTKAGHFYAFFPTNNPNGWKPMQVNHHFLALVVQCLARLRVSYDSGAKY